MEIPQPKDYTKDQETWELLQSQVELKQKIINQKTSELKEKDDHLIQRGRETVMLREHLKQLDQELFNLEE